MLFFCSKNGSVLYGQQGILQGKKWYNLFVCNGFGDDIGYISGGKWCNWQHCWRCCQFLVEWLTTLDVFQWYRALARSTREESLLRKKWSGRSAIKNNSNVFCCWGGWGCSASATVGGVSSSGHKYVQNKPSVAEW